MLHPVSFSQLSHQPLIPADMVSLILVTASSRSLALPVAPTSSQSGALENLTQSTHRSVFLPPTLSHWGRKQSGRSPGAAVSPGSTDPCLRVHHSFQTCDLQVTLPRSAAHSHHGAATFFAKSTWYPLPLWTQEVHSESDNSVSYLLKWSHHLTSQSVRFSVPLSCLFFSMPLTPYFWPPHLFVCLLIFFYLPPVECKLYKDGDFCPFCLLLYPQPGM